MSGCRHLLPLILLSILLGPTVTPAGQLKATVSQSYLKEGPDNGLGPQKEEREKPAQEMIEKSMEAQEPKLPMTRGNLNRPQSTGKISKTAGTTDKKEGKRVDSAESSNSEWSPPYPPPAQPAPWYSTIGSSRPRGTTSGGHGSTQPSPEDVTKKRPRNPFFKKNLLQEPEMKNDQPSLNH
jgi:hypothetical protein